MKLLLRSPRPSTMIPTVQTYAGIRNQSSHVRRSLFDLKNRTVKNRKTMKTVLMMRKETHEAYRGARAAFALSSPCIGRVSAVDMVIRPGRYLMFYSRVFMWKDCTGCGGSMYEDVPAARNGNKGAERQQIHWRVRGAKPLSSMSTSLDKNAARVCDVWKGLHGDLHETAEQNEDETRKLGRKSER